MTTADISKNEEIAAPRYAVVVDPGDWTRSTDDLIATLTTPVEQFGGRVEVRTLGERLADGPATVARGLSKVEARGLVKQLSARRISARLLRVRSPHPEVASAPPSVDPYGSVAEATGEVKPADSSTTGSNRRAGAQRRPHTPRSVERKGDPGAPQTILGWTEPVSAVPVPVTKPKIGSAPSATSSNTLLGFPTHEAIAWSNALGADPANLQPKPTADVSARSPQPAARSAPPEARESDTERPDPPIAPKRGPNSLPEGIVGWGDVIPPTPKHTDRVLDASETAEQSATLSRIHITEDEVIVGGAAAESDETASVLPEAEQNLTRDLVAPKAAQGVVPKELEAAIGGGSGADHLPGAAIPQRELIPKPRLATLLSAIAPGAGQVYLGDSEAARQYLMTAPLVVPWLRSAQSAGESARQIASGKRLAKARPDLPRAVGWAFAFWICLGTLILLLSAGYRELTAPAVGPNTVNGVDPLDQDSGPEIGDADQQALSLDSEQTIGDELDGRRTRLEVRRLTRYAFEACAVTDWERCAELSGRARELDPSFRQASRLYHRALLRLRDEEQFGSREGSGH